MSRPQPAPSNIRVSVSFTSPVVFAGEDVSCTITFKNTAREQGSPRERSPGYDTVPPRNERSRKVTPIQPQRLSRQSSYGYGPNLPAHLRKGHRPAQSIGSVAGSDVGGGTGGGSRPRHGRSLSILSVGTDTGTVASIGTSRGGGGQEKSPRQQHERHMSVQTPSPRRVSKGGAQEAAAPVISEDLIDGGATIRPKRRTRPMSEAQRSPGILQQNFKFPAVNVTDESENVDSPSEPTSAISPTTNSNPLRSLSPPILDSSANPIARVLSQSSVNGSSSPRSSLDLYSEAMSNHSDETMASEYLPQQMARLLPRPPMHTRNNSRLGVREPPRGPETIMMGYVQIGGSFTLEGSLVNQAPFEEVKRKGVVGGHGGGGVVGVERSKRDSGLFGSFGWGNIGESLGGLLGGGELSSIKEMRGIANSKSIPLLTTPPAILFVDQTLQPGESKSFTYQFTLPRGLPPTHRGRAVKVSYQLTIGTQRTGKGKEQLVRSIDVPFRLFGGVDVSGEILGHDLMSPYILLRDQAVTSAVSSPSSKPDVKPKKPPDRGKGEDEFKSYIAALLDRSAENGQPALLSPTSPFGPGPPSDVQLKMRRASSVGEQLQSQADLIDLAILRSNHADHKPTNGTTTFNNKFEIVRDKQHVATLHLPRPAYRLGETIHLVVDLKGADISTYAVQVALETRETVDPAIAMRGAASIYRYTRKVHAYDACNALFARRLTFALGIPSSATPEFMTTGLALEWRVRVEFVTPRMATRPFPEELLEEVAEDDRGLMLQGVEGLRVESFEVGVPVRVYGGGSGASIGEWDVAGLAV